MTKTPNKIIITVKSITLSLAKVKPVPISVDSPSPSTEKNLVKSLTPFNLPTDQKISDLRPSNLEICISLVCNTLKTTPKANTLIRTVMPLFTKVLLTRELENPIVKMKHYSRNDKKC